MSLSRLERVEALVSDWLPVGMLSRILAYDLKVGGLKGGESQDGFESGYHSVSSQR